MPTINRRPGCQRGFTLIELIIGLAVSGVLALAVSLLFYELLTVNASSSNHITAILQVQNAGYWISRDAAGAQTIVEDNNPESSEFLTLRWQDWDGVDYESFYYFNGHQLRRSFTVAAGAPTDTAVAEYIDYEATTFVSSGASWVLTVKATVGGFPWPASETRTYEVLPRPPSI